MIALTVHLDLDTEPWTDLQSDEPVLGTLSRIGLLRHGTGKGNASVGLVLTMPDGTQVIGQTTWALLRTAYAAMAASPLIAEEVINP